MYTRREYTICGEIGDDICSQVGGEVGHEIGGEVGGDIVGGVGCNDILITKLSCPWGMSRGVD